MERTLCAVHQVAEADFSRRKQACGFFRRLSAGPLAVINIQLLAYGD